MVSPDVWNMQMSSGIRFKLPRRRRKNLHVVFPDLVNAFGSLTHEILWAAFNFFQVPESITRIVKVYFQNLQFCIATQNTTTAWQHLETGIMAGCIISGFPSRMLSPGGGGGTLSRGRCKVCQSHIPSQARKVGKVRCR